MRGGITRISAESPIGMVHLSADYFEKISECDWLEVRSRLNRKGKRLLFLSSKAFVED